jgi:hypothetical protein
MLNSMQFFGINSILDGLSLLHSVVMGNADAGIGILGIFKLLQVADNRFLELNLLEA